MIIDIYDGAEFVERREVGGSMEAYYYCDMLCKQQGKDTLQWIEYKEMIEP